MRAREFDANTAPDLNSPAEVHAQLRRWAMHDQNLRNKRFIPFLNRHRQELAQDGSKANAMRLWYGTDRVDASGYFDPLDERSWQRTARKFIKDNIDTILRDPGGWTSQTDGHNVVLAHIIVQHMDDSPDFQEWFLHRMQADPRVAKANDEQIKFLSDRVEVNRSGYWDSPDAGRDGKTIPRGTFGTQGNRYSMDHANRSETNKDRDDASDGKHVGAS